MAPPGRILAAAALDTFKELAEAIDDSFGRWDRSHLQEFTLADGACRSLTRTGRSRARSPRTTGALGSPGYGPVSSLFTFSILVTTGRTCARWPRAGRPTYDARDNPGQTAAVLGVG